MWDLVPWPGIELRPSALGVQILVTGPPGKSSFLFFKLLDWILFVVTIIIKTKQKQTIHKKQNKKILHTEWE